MREREREMKREYARMCECVKEKKEMERECLRVYVQLCSWVYVWCLREGIYILVSTCGCLPVCAYVCVYVSECQREREREI